MTCSTNQKPNILVLGSINMDLIVKSARLPTKGETLTGDSFNYTPGGKGANQAVTASKLGANSKLIARVGNDLFGKQLTSYLSSQNVDTNSITIDSDSHSGIAMIHVDSSTGENRILAVYGANMQCDKLELATTKKLIPLSNCLMIQLEIPKQISFQASKFALSLGVRTILDPSPASHIETKEFAMLDIITPNQTEAEFYTGIKIIDATSAEKAAKKFVHWGVKLAVIKMGEHGAFFASSMDNGHVKAFKIPVVDTTGAGDAFNAALAIEISKGTSIQKAVKTGNAAGAIAASKHGAQKSMPTSEEINQLLCKP